MRITISQTIEWMIDHCRALARFTDEPGFTTRTFLSPPMHGVHAYLSDWMKRAGMNVHVDAVGNLRGRWGGEGTPLWIGSHLDSVPRAGAFDGILGVVMAIGLVEQAKPPFPVEVIGFSEEEGVRFGVPFIGSRAIIGDAMALMDKCDPDGVSVSDAIRAYGLDPVGVPAAEVQAPSRGYLEFHIEQGPVLEGLNLPVAAVDSIAGLTRLMMTFAGHANHAGTTPMALRRDALAGAAEWIAAVEREGQSVTGLVATVGRIQAEPGAANVIPGRVRATLDLRHAQDTVRKSALSRLSASAQDIASRRGLTVSSEELLDQSACPMDAGLVSTLERAITATGHRPHRMTSGAGHDAMIMARRMPATMLFLRSPGGISHHPDENVFAEDVETAMAVGRQFLLEVK
jgi:allantoate deiminase